MEGAESAAAADATMAAKQQQERLPGKPKKSFFAMSDKRKLKKIQDLGQERMNLLINGHADDFYNVQSEMVMKADLNGKRTSCIAEAIRAQTDHLLGFIMPGQVLMLLKEDKLESDLDSVKADLSDILEQLSYYKQENKEIRTAMDTSNNLIRTMGERSQEHINIIRQMQSEAAATKAEIVGLRREIYLLRETDRGQRPTQENQDQFDQANRGQSNSRGRGRGSSRGGRGQAYGGPYGGQKHPDPPYIPHVTGSNAAFDPTIPSNKFHMDGLGKTPSQKRDEARNQNIYGNGNNEDKDTGMDMSDDIQTNHGFQDPKRSRNKNKNKQPETVPMTKKQLRYAKELIIHKVPSQKKEDYKDEDDYKEKEADILYNLLEELSPKHLGENHGVVVNIKKDIDFMDRFDKHYDEENGGMAPIRLRFFTVRMCNKVLKAAQRAGCLKGRRPSDFGKYAVPKKYDNAGNLNDKADEEAKRLADLRPAFYFRPSLPREERLEKDEEKKKRDEKKNDPETKAFRDRRKEALDKRVRFGNSRNFGKGEADKASEKSVQEKENYLKEIREKKAAKEREKVERERAEEKERLDKLKVNNESYPILGSGNQFEKLKIGNNSDTQNGSFHSANSSPNKEQTENR